MIIVAEPREKLIALLPSDAHVAEVGVAQGEFSRLILDATGPRRLHLVDPWRRFDDELYLKDGNNAPDDEQERRYRDILRRFTPEIAAGQVQVHRMLSTEAADQLPDGSLDWIYLDANHTYEAVRSDLAALLPKLKSDGFLCGHDYTNSPWAQRMAFGVVEAVNEFLDQTGLQFVALTKELYPSYLLSRPGRHVDRLEERIRQRLTVEREFAVRTPRQFRLQFRKPALLTRVACKLGLTPRPDPYTQPEFRFCICGESF